MAWREEDHPRDDDGKFTDGNGTYRQNSLEPYKPTSKPLSLKLPDEQLPHSVGAKWRNEKITMPDGSEASFLEGSKLQDKEVFAGYGTRVSIRKRFALTEKYPKSTPEKWQKIKAKAEIVTKEGETIKAEVHWYEEKTIGKVEFKYKKSL